MKVCKRLLSAVLAMIMVLSLLPVVNASIYPEDIGVVEAGELGTITIKGANHDYAKTNLALNPGGHAIAYVTVYDVEGEVSSMMELMDGDSEILYYLSPGTVIEVDVLQGSVSVECNYVNGATRPDLVIHDSPTAKLIPVQLNISSACMTVGEKLQLSIANADSRLYVAPTPYTGNTTDDVFLSDGYAVKDSSIAEIDKKGMITAKAPGETYAYMAYHLGLSETRCYTFYQRVTIKVVKDYGIQEAYDNYYAAGNDKYFNIVVLADEDVRTTGFDIQVGDQTYSTGNDYQTMITFPDNYTADVVISKEGYLPYTLENRYISAYNWVILSPETKHPPIIQNVLARSVADSEWRNLKTRTMSVFEETAEEYLVDVSVNWGGRRAGRVWLQQGTTTIPITNGSTGNVPLGQLLRNSGEPVYVCAQDENGTTVKSRILLNVMSPEKYARLDFGDNGGLIGEYTGEEDAFQNLPFKLELSGNISFEFFVDMNGKVKGTLGVTGTGAKSTATYYEDIKETVTRMEILGNKLDTKARSKKIADLADRIEENDGAILTSRTDVIFSLGTFNVIGYVEGKLVEGKLQVDEMGMVCTIGGGASTSQECLAFTPTFNWELGVKAQLEVPIKSVRQDNSGSFLVTIPKTTIQIAITGAVHLGTKEMTKMLDIGVQLDASLSIEMPKDGGLSDSIWTLNATFRPLAAISGYSFTDEYWDAIEDWQIYPTEPMPTASPLAAMTDEANYTLLPRSPFSQGMVFAQGGVETDAQNFVTVETVATNTYADSAPQILDLGDRELLVWLTDEPGRSDENRTCLYYAVYHKETATWSQCAAVLDNGCPDYDPVLQLVDGVACLAWSKASNPYEPGVTLSQTAQLQDIYYAEFDPATNTFPNPENISGENGVYDTDPQIVSTKWGTSVVWRQNSENDVFGRQGTNTILSTTRTEEGWELAVMASGLKTISGMTACAEEGELTVYFAADTDDDYETDQDTELFCLVGQALTQLTQNDYCDALPTWENNTLYRYENGELSDGTQPISSASQGMGYRFVSNESGSFRAVLYTLTDSDMTNNIYASVNDGHGWSQSVPVTALKNTYISDFSAYYNGTELVVVANCQEINADATLGRTRIVKCTKAFTQDLGVEKAHYITYSLVEGGTLMGYADVTNHGLNTLQHITLELCDQNGTVLCHDDQEVLLLPGQTKTLKFYCDVADLPADAFVVRASSIGCTDGWADNDCVTVTLNVDDISVESAFGTLNADGSATVTAFIHNRGLNSLTGVTLTFRKDSPTGDVLHTLTLDTLQSGTPVPVTFTSTTLGEWDTVYVCAAPLDSENILANNTDFAVVQDPLAALREEDIVETPASITDAPVKLDYTYFISGDYAYHEAVFTPEETGYYRIQMLTPEQGRSPWLTTYTCNELSVTQGTATELGQNYQTEDHYYYWEAGTEHTFNFTTRDTYYTQVIFSQVEQVAPSQIVLEQESISRYEFDLSRIHATFRPDGSFGALHFASSDETVFTVDEYGYITFRKPGTAVITVTADGTTASAQCQVTTLAKEKTPLEANTQYTQLDTDTLYSFTPKADGFYQLVGSYSLYDAQWYHVGSDSGVSTHYLQAGETYNLYLDEAALTILPCPQLRPGQTLTASLDVEIPSAYYTFIPEADGVYAFSSTGEYDTYGHLYSQAGSELASDDDAGDGSNFRVRIYLEAGTPYLLRARFYSAYRVGSFQVQVEMIPTVTSMEILSLPDQMDYIQGMVADHLDYDGLKIRFSWSDGTTTDWTPDDSHYLEDEKITFHTDEADTTGLVWVSYLDLSASFYINLLENPVSRLEVVAGSAPAYIEDADGYISSRYNEETEESEEFFYYPMKYAGLRIKVHYKNGTTKTVQADEDAYYYWELDDYEIMVTTNQYNSPWTVGGSNEVTVEYMGVTTTFRATVLPNPVASIEVVKGPDLDTVSQDYLPDFTGLAIRIHYTNGTSKVVTATGSNVVTLCDTYAPFQQYILVDGQKLMLKHDWSYDDDAYHHTASYLGRTCSLDDAFAYVPAREVASVTAENVTETGAGMLIHITYTDGGTETLRMNKVYYGGIPDTDVSGVMGYGLTSQGYLSYELTAYYDDDGNLSPYHLYILGQKIEVELSQGLLGDVNGDGKINMKDWSILYDHVNEITLLTGDALTRADVNHDGKVNMKDWSRLYEHVNEINPL